jgi:hypothetical protein
MTPAARPDTAARWFVRAVTVGCCLTAGWFVAKQGTPYLPVQDEWLELYQHLETPFGEWAFGHHNEHRYPLGRAVWAGVLRATGYDFRAPMFASVGLLTAAAVLLQLAAHKLRGFTHPIDALPVVLLLHWGHAFNLLMGYQVTFVWLAYAMAGWVWCGVNWGAGKRVGWAWGGAAYAVSLLFGGGFGLAFTPVVAAWLGYSGVTLARDRRWLSAGLFLLLAVGAVGYSAWVYRTMPPLRTERLNPVRQPGKWLTGSAEFLGGGVGEWGPEHEGGPLRWSATAAVLGAFAGAAWAGGRWVWKHPPRRRAGVTVLAVLAGATGCALAVGLVRTGGTLGGRFATPAAGGLAVAVTVLGVAIRTGRGWSLTTAAGVLAVAGLLGWLNYTPAHRLAYDLRSSLHGLKTDLQAGVPPTVLAGRHGGGFGVLVGDFALDILPRYKRHAVGVCSQMADDPPFAAVPVSGVTLPAVPTDPTAALAQPDGFPIRLPEPPPGAFAVRLRMAAGLGMRHQPLTCTWTRPTAGSSSAHASWDGRAGHLVLTFDGRPTDLTISGYRGLQPIEAVEWLVVSP